jgi:hypothetical protein
MFFAYPYNALAYNAANGVSPFFSLHHSRAPKGVSAGFTFFRSFSNATRSEAELSSDSKNSSPKDTTLVFNSIITSLSAVQKNLASAKRQLNALANYSSEEIRENSSLRLKAAQLDLTLKHIFEESTMAFSKKELEQILKMLESVK